MDGIEGEVVTISNVIINKTKASDLKILKSIYGQKAINDL